MTAKNKAQELLEMFDNLRDLYIPDADYHDKEIVELFNKECARAAIDQILEIASDYSEEKIVTKRFWNNVKKKIESI